mgnify:CR=1 FL=1
MGDSTYNDRNIGTFNSNNHTNNCVADNNEGEEEMNEHDATEAAYKNGYARAKEDIIENINTRIAKLKRTRDEMYRGNAPLALYVALQTLEELKKEISDE